MRPIKFIFSIQALTVGAIVFVGLTAPSSAADAEQSLRKQALALNRLSGDDALSGQFKIMLLDTKGSKKLLGIAKQMVKGKPQPFYYSAAYLFAHLAEEFKDNQAGELFYRVCIDHAARLQSGQKMSLAYVSLIAMHYDSGNYAASAKICQEFLERKPANGKPKEYLLAADLDEDEEPTFVPLESYDPVRRHKPGVHRLLVQSITKQGKFDEALKLVNNLIKADPEEWLDLQLKGWVFREAGRFKDAAEVYEQVIAKIEKDKTLDKEEKSKYAERYRYSLSNIYVDMNQIGKAAQALKDLLAKKPNDPTYNNDLGFIWADHDMNLAEAEKLVRKALDEDRKRRRLENPNLKPEEIKDHGAYLDSLGWVLYKQKKYKEAKEILVKAVEDKESQHIEIFDHLGDVYLALGDKAKAVAAWKTGLGFASESKRDRARKEAVAKKIKENEGK